MKKNLLKKSELKSAYDNLMKEYDFNHFKQTEPYEKISRCTYFSFHLPHYEIAMPDKITNKSASCFQCLKFYELNKPLSDELYTGLTLQRDLMLLMVIWRTFKYIFK